MAGVPPLLGFVAKEAVFTAFLEAAAAGDAVGVDRARRRVPRLGAHGRLHRALRLGRVLHEGGRRADRRCTPSSRAIGVAPGLLAAASLVVGVRDRVHRAAARRLRRRAPRPRGVPPRALARPRAGALRSRSPCSPSARCSCGAASGSPACRPPSSPVVDSARGYLGIVSVVDRLAAAVTTAIQHRGLPGYLAIIVDRVRRRPRRGIRHEHHLARRHPPLGLPGAAVPRASSWASPPSPRRRCASA